MNILYLTTDIAWPLGFGGEIRKWNVLQGLLRAGRTDAVVCRRSSEPLAQAAFAGCGRILELPARDFLRSPRVTRLHRSTLGRGWLTLSSPFPYEYRSAGLAALRTQLKRAIDPEDYDLIWFATPRAALFFTGRRRVASVLDGDDFSYVRNLGLLRSAPWYGAKLLDYLDVAKMWAWERTDPRRFSFIVRCSAEDRARIPAANIVVIPNGAEVPREVKRAPRPRILFVGYLGYAPNRQGMEWFLRAVWPIVRRGVPRAELDIVGLEPSAALLAAHGTEGVSVHGFIEDLTPLYERAALSIVPLLAGSGTRLKILEALGRAVPVVSTTLGAYGIDAGRAQGLERADAAESFAAACVAHLEDCAGEALRRAERGRERVLERYDWTAIRVQVGELARRAVAAHSSQSGRLTSARK